MTTIIDNNIDVEDKKIQNIYKVKKDELISEVCNIIKLDDLPDEVIIATMTIVCKLDIVFNLENIARFIELKNNIITKVSYGRHGDASTNRTIGRKKKNKHKKKGRIFYNQVTLCIFVDSKKDKPINVKLFENGSIHMTGCKNTDQCFETLSIMFYELGQQRAIIDYKTNTVIDKPFVDDITKLNILHVKNINVAMIQCGFKFPGKIDRMRLYKKLIEHKNVCKFDPKQHAGVNIKFDIHDRTVSIFVFEKGSIVITGAKNCLHIKYAYEFINKFLLQNIIYILKNTSHDIDLNKILSNDETDSDEEAKNIGSNIKLKRGRKRRDKSSNTLSCSQ